MAGDGTGAWLKSCRPGGVGEACDGSEDVRVGVVEEGADDARLEELALLLRQELLTLDVRAVEPYREGEAPDGYAGPVSPPSQEC